MYIVLYLSRLSAFRLTFSLLLWQVYGIIRCSNFHDPIERTKRKETGEEKRIKVSSRVCALIARLAPSAIDPFSRIDYINRSNNNNIARVMMYEVGDRENSPGAKREYGRRFVSNSLWRRREPIRRERSATEQCRRARLTTQFTTYDEFDRRPYISVYQRENSTMPVHPARKCKACSQQRPPSPPRMHVLLFKCNWKTHRCPTSSDFRYRLRKSSWNSVCLKK